MNTSTSTTSAGRMRRNRSSTRRCSLRTSSRVLNNAFNTSGKYSTSKTPFSIPTAITCSSIIGSKMQVESLLPIWVPPPCKILSFSIRESMRISILRLIEILVHSKSSAPAISRARKVRYRKLIPKVVHKSDHAAKKINTPKESAKTSQGVKQYALLNRP